MTNYTIDDVVTVKDILSGRIDVQDLIGKEGYFFDIFTLSDANEIVGLNDLRTLQNVKLDDTCVFYDGMSRWSYFIPKKNPEFRVGDFIRDPESDLLGMILEDCGDGYYRVRFNGEWKSTLERAYRFTHVSAHMKPFDLDNPKVREDLMGEVIRMDNIADVTAHDMIKHEILELMITGFKYLSDIGWKVMMNNFMNTADVLLNTFNATFLDGFPFGVITTDKESKLICDECGKDIC